jgi:hypothetical protein
MPGQGPTIPDGWELNKDGTITLTVDGNRTRLRRPKMGEFRDLREALRQRDDDRLRVIAKHPPLEDHDTEGDEATDDEKLERVLAIQGRSRAMADEVRELNLAWVELVLSTLAEKEPPPRDDWPSGTDEDKFLTDLMEHWRSVPLRSGGG